MKLMLKLAAIVCAAMLATGAAYAQAPSGPSVPGYGAENPSIRNGGDTTERDALRARDDAVAANRKPTALPKTARAVPASPGDVTVGSEVRDKKGAVVGTIESVSMAAAVVVSAGGKVEVPLEAFGKNNKGLLIGMTKAEFDAAVAAAVKPGG